MTPTEFSLRPEAAGDAAHVETVLDVAFGPGRHTRTAYRLREGTADLRDLAFVAEAGGALIGSIRYWPIRVGGRRDALLLGPLAIRPDWQGMGCGIALMTHTLELAKAQGHRLVILVGDLPYYSRVGFSRIAPGQVTLPGPVDPTRLLWLELEPGASDGVSGEVGRHPEYSMA